VRQGGKELIELVRQLKLELPRLSEMSGLEPSCARRIA